jgi:uncharacterized phage protein (TIGR01671 family)
MYIVNGLHFDRGMVQYANNDNAIRFIKLKNIILMQSTGLYDKNGKEVFVGDIIKCTRGCPHEVYLEKEYGGTYVGGMPAIYLKGIREGYAWTGAEEILGNIYENPELLEVEE